MPATPVVGLIPMNDDMEIPPSVLADVHAITYKTEAIRADRQIAAASDTTRNTGNPFGDAGTRRASGPVNVMQANAYSVAPTRTMTVMIASATVKEPIPRSSGVAIGESSVDFASVRVLQPLPSSTAPFSLPAWPTQQGAK